MIEEDPTVIQMNIAHYRAMLKLDLDHAKRSIVERLLAEASHSLTLTSGSCLSAGMTPA